MVTTTRPPPPAGRQLWQPGVESREAPSLQGKKLTWYAAIYDALSEDLGSWREKIAAGAFSRSLGRDDVIATVNHNRDLLLGRTRSGTLRLHDDARGLQAEVDLPDTQVARDLKTLLLRGDLTAGSFSFLPEKEPRWEGNVRIVERARLFDVAIVVQPAYLQTEGSAALRGIESPEVRSLLLGQRPARRPLTAAERAAWLEAHEHLPLSAAQRRATLDRLKPPEHRARGGPLAWGLDLAPPRGDIRLPDY